MKQKGKHSERKGLPPAGTCVYQDEPIGNSDG
jgi:hypothetical protein